MCCGKTAVRLASSPSNYATCSKRGARSLTFSRHGTAITAAVFICGPTVVGRRLRHFEAFWRWLSGLCPVSRILNVRERDVSETSLFSGFIWGEGRRPPHTWGRKRIKFLKVCVFLYLEFRTMVKFQAPNDSELMDMFIIWRDWQKSRQAWVTIAYIPVNIRTQYLLTAPSPCRQALGSHLKRCGPFFAAATRGALLQWLHNSLSLPPCRKITFVGSRARPVRTADNLSADCLDNAGSSTSHNAIGLHGVYFFLEAWPTLREVFERQVVIAETQDNGQGPGPERRQSMRAANPSASDRTGRPDACSSVSVSRRRWTSSGTHFIGS
jgi:hypothetical protein